jgi:hypothetical protein
MRPSVSDVNAYFDGKCILSGERMRPRVLISAPSPKYPFEEKFVIAGA